MFRKNKDKVLSLLKITFYLRIFSVIGFIIAFAVYSILRGNGDITSGIVRTLKEETMRRTFSIGIQNSDINNIALESIEASL